MSDTLKPYARHQAILGKKNKVRLPHAHLVLERLPDQHVGDVLVINYNPPVHHLNGISEKIGKGQDIVKMYADGDIVLSLGRHPTQTAARYINEAIEDFARVFTTSDRWFLGLDQSGQAHFFSDGITFNADSGQLVRLSNTSPTIKQGESDEADIHA